MHYLYKITCLINQKNYIGQTVQPAKRWYQHKLSSKAPKQIISRAIHKFGENNFTFEIIAECKTQDDANWAEEELIKQYDSLIKNNKGYNLSVGGGGKSGLKCSEETKKKLSKASMGNINRKVQITSEDTKNKMSKSHKGKHHSIKTEYKKGNPGPQLGIKPSEETKRKKSASMTGKTWKLINGKRVWSNSV